MEEVSRDGNEGSCNIFDSINQLKGLFHFGIFVVEFTKMNFDISFLLVVSRYAMEMRGDVA